LVAGGGPKASIGEVTPGLHAHFSVYRVPVDEMSLSGFS